MITMRTMITGYRSKQKPHIHLKPCYVYSPLSPPPPPPPPPPTHTHTHTDTPTTSSRYLLTPLPSQRSNVQPEKRRKWQQKHGNTWKRKRTKRKNLGTNPNTETSSKTYSHTLSLAGSARTIHLYIYSLLKCLQP